MARDGSIGQAFVDLNDRLSGHWQFDAVGAFSVSIVTFSVSVDIQNMAGVKTQCRAICFTRGRHSESRRPLKKSRLSIRALAVVEKSDGRD